MRALVTGGAASGKSEFAELLLTRLAGDMQKYYIATMPDFGGESRERIEKHRRSRAGRGFETVERMDNLAELQLPTRGGCALLEDIGNLVANEMFGGAGADGAAERVARGVLHVAAQCEMLVVVTNDVSRDGAEYEAETLEYIRIIEQVGQALAEGFDEVYEVIAGIALRVK